MMTIFTDTQGKTNGLCMCVYFMMSLTDNPVKSESVTAPCSSEGRRIMSLRAVTIVHTAS